MSIRAKTLRASCLLLAVVSVAGLLHSRSAKGDDGKLLPFDPKGWETKTDYKPLGDPKAKRDCKDPFVIRWEEFPPTLRCEGPNSNLVQTRTFQAFLYESLIGIHPETDEVIPQLASHWKREIDEKAGNQTFWFHIDPRARFSDGSEVTAEDVAATFWHLTQEDRNDPSNYMTFNEGFNAPEVLDKYTIKVKTKEINWRLFFYFGGMNIYSAKEVKIPGKKFLEDYNWKFLMGSGPYIMKEDGLKSGESLTITRRNDWWAENEPWAKNTCNFAQIKSTVVRDEELEYQMVKKGDLDHYVVARAKRWVDEIPKEEVVQKGWLKRRRVFHQAPGGTNGIAFNMREKPFDNRDVRLAFCYLFNREKLMDKLFFNQYEFLNSYEPGRDWGNEDENDIITYDPKKAAQLLAAAGWNKRNAAGFLEDKDGNQFELTLELGSPTLERIFLVVKEDFEKGGIKLNLKLIDDSTRIKKVGERQFKITFQSWGGLQFPNPETSWRSDLADKNNNNNITGFKDKRVDELCKKYNVTFDVAEQKKICREIDKIVYDAHPYALGWGAQYYRVLYWDKFGHPDSYFTRVVEDPTRDMALLWWWDADKMKALADARANDKALDQGTVDVKPWEKKK